MNVDGRNWTISIGTERRIGEPFLWGVYCDGKLVSDGWLTSGDADWGRSFLINGERPLHVPSGYEIAWPEGVLAQPLNESTST